MPVTTAAEFRNRVILVSIDGTDGQQLQCRRPDLLQLIADGALSLEVYGDVLERLHALFQSDNVIDNRPLPEQLPYDAFVDRFVCAAVVAPKVVLTDEEVIADPEAIWVSDLPRATRYEVVRVCNRALASPRLKTAVADFRLQQSLGLGVGPDGETVREDAVGVAPGA